MASMCGGCEATWTGRNVCHCAGCHNTFSVLTWFDYHRKYGKCKDPATLTIRSGKDGPRVVAMKLNEHGVWVGAVPNPRFQEDE